MSHRERCMSGVFGKILSHLGLLKQQHSSPAPPSPPPPPPPPPRLPSPPSIPPSSCGLPPPNTQGCSTCSDRNTPADGPLLGTFNVFINDKDNPSVNNGSTAKSPTGFRVRVYNEPFAPVVVECTPGSGGVQGLQWYSEKLRMDEDGDVAQEFLDEVVSQASGPLAGYSRLLPSFKIKRKTRPAKLKGPVCTFDGNVVQTVESCAFVKHS